MKTNLKWYFLNILTTVVIVYILGCYFSARTIYKIRKEQHSLDHDKFTAEDFARFQNIGYFIAQIQKSDNKKYIPVDLEFYLKKNNEKPILLDRCSFSTCSQKIKVAMSGMGSNNISYDFFLSSSNYSNPRSLNLQKYIPNFKSDFYEQFGREVEPGKPVVYFSGEKKEQAILFYKVIYK